MERVVEAGGSDGREDDRMEVDNTDDHMQVVSKRCRLTDAQESMGSSDNLHFGEVFWEGLLEVLRKRNWDLFLKTTSWFYWEGPPKMKESAWDDTFLHILRYCFPSCWTKMLRVCKAWRDILLYCPKVREMTVHFRPSMQKMLPYKKVDGKFVRCSFWDASKYQIVGHKFVSKLKPGIDLVCLVSLPQLVGDIRYNIEVLDLRHFDILPPLRTIRGMTWNSLNFLTEIHLPLRKDLFGPDNHLWGLASYFQENHRPPPAKRDIDGERAAAGHWVRKIFKIVRLCKHCTKVDISNRDLLEIGNQSARPALVEALIKCTQLRHVNISGHNLETFANKQMTGTWWRTIVPVLMQNQNMYIYDDEWIWLWCAERKKVKRILFTVGGDAWSYALQA